MNKYTRTTQDFVLSTVLTPQIFPDSVGDEVRKTENTGEVGLGERGWAMETTLARTAFGHRRGPQRPCSRDEPATLTDGMSQTGRSQSLK